MFTREDVNEKAVNEEAVNEEAVNEEANIVAPLRQLPLTLVIAAILGLGTASAQTVIVQSAPPGSTIELTLNGASVSSVTADKFGDATLAVGARANETDVLVYIDSCSDRVRVQLAGRGQLPAPPLPACTRVDVGSMFIMRPTTTFVVDITPSVAVHVAQGPAPSEWLLRGAGSGPRATTLSGTPTTGFVLSAGIGGSIFGTVADKGCGDVAGCLTTHSGIALKAGAEYWFTRFAAAEVAYVKPADVGSNGSGDTFHFDSNVQTRLFTIAGKGGVSVGPARIYGLGGVNHHEATFTSSETINDTTVVVNGVTQTIKGGTVSFAEKTTGWNWLAGGGVEAWVNHWIAIDGEVEAAKIKGNPVSGGGSGIDELMWLAFIAVHVRLGG
jgi:hypothetical protein